MMKSVLFSVMAVRRCRWAISACMKPWTDFILYMEGACGVRLNADDEVGPIFRNGRASLSLGYIGLHETL
ncbi:hypothetical protein HZD82_22380, partial [Pantoea agglomerans]|nr:hypothetical protein [Pantoea agglomerans]